MLCQNSNHHQFFKNSSTQCMKVTQKLLIPKVSYAIKCLNFKIKKLQNPNTNRIRIVSENANYDRRNRKIQIQMIFNHCVLERTALSYSVIDKKKYFWSVFFQTLSTLFSLMIADTYIFFSSVPKRKLKSNNRIKRFVYHVPYIAQCLKWYNYQKTNILARKFKNYILILYLHFRIDFVEILQ